MQAPMAPRRRNHAAAERSPPRALSGAAAGAAGEEGGDSSSPTSRFYASSREGFARMTLDGESPLASRSTKRPKLALPSSTRRAPPFGLGATFALEAPSPMLASRSGGLREASFGEERAGAGMAAPDSEFYGYRHAHDVPGTPMRRPAFDAWSPPASPGDRLEDDDEDEENGSGSGGGGGGGSSSSARGSLSPQAPWAAASPRSSLSPAVASVAAGLAAMMRPSPSSGSSAGPPPPAPKRRPRPSAEGAGLLDAAAASEGGFLRRGSLPSAGKNSSELPHKHASPAEASIFNAVTTPLEENDDGGCPAVAPGAPLHLPPAPSSRFREDFEQLEAIGGGSFGTVHKVRSRLDGCLYAVKCTRRRIKGERDRGMMLKEVRALAELCDKGPDTSHVVRYHQAWIEGERLYIQTELCDTSLDQFLGRSEHCLSENETWDFLRQVLLGLCTLHQNGMVHLDVKPGNIFLKGGRYKLGDFGLVTRANAVGDVAEGDSRYMSLELLREDHTDLTKCDVFSLGITLYELLASGSGSSGGNSVASTSGAAASAAAATAAGHEDSLLSEAGLPPNGEGWHRLRSGDVPLPAAVPAELARVVRLMMHPDPALRPTAAELLALPALQSDIERQLQQLSSRNQQLELDIKAMAKPHGGGNGGGGGNGAPRFYKKGHSLKRNNTLDNSYLKAGLSRTGEEDVNGISWNSFQALPQLARRGPATGAAGGGAAAAPLRSLPEMGCDAMET